jgi:hypothetical protein
MEVPILRIHDTDYWTWVERYAQQNGGVEGVRRALHRSDVFDIPIRPVATEWLRLKDLAAQTELDERAVRASESQAQSARRALILSLGALVLSAAALLVSIAALFKP